MIFAELQESNGETLLVIRAVAPKDSSQETPTELPNFTIYIDESWITHDYIIPAITDVTTRTFKDDQIKLMTACQEAPNHLVVEKFKKIEAAHAATQPHETLILITAEQDEKDHYLTAINTKTGEEFKVSNQIELTDALCDFVKPLKIKTMTNIQVRFLLNSAFDLVPTGNEPIPRNEGNEYLISLNDLASEVNHELRYFYGGKTVEMTYSYEDTTIARQVSGGQSI